MFVLMVTFPSLAYACWPHVESLRYREGAYEMGLKRLGFRTNILSLFTELGCKSGQTLSNNLDRLYLNPFLLRV